MVPLLLLCTPETLCFVLFSFNYCKLDASLTGFYRYELYQRQKYLGPMLWECQKCLDIQG